MPEEPKPKPVRDPVPPPGEMPPDPPVPEEPLPRQREDPGPIPGIPPAHDPLGYPGPTPPREV